MWLRRLLAAFAGLLALAVTCALLWGLLASMGDVVGAKAFRGITLIAAIADGLCGVALLIGTTACVIRVLDPPHALRKSPHVQHECR